MRITRGVAAAALAGALGLTGCAGPLAEAPAGPHPQEEGANVGLTWQDAKAHAQSMELEIAALIPEDEVVAIEQKEAGVLLSCDQTQHSWNGSINVTVVEGAETELIVKAIEAHYRGSSFEVSVDRAVDGAYRVQLRSADRSESYIVVEGLTPDSIRIASSSACFTLPDDVYPGGKF